MIWNFENESLPSNAKIIQQPNPSVYHLVLTNVQLNNIGSYICHGHDNDKITFQDKAVLTVKGK